MYTFILKVKKIQYYMLIKGFSNVFVRFLKIKKQQYSIL